MSANRGESRLVTSRQRNHGGKAASLSLMVASLAACGGVEETEEAQGDAIPVTETSSTNEQTTAQENTYIVGASVGGSVDLTDVSSAAQIVVRNTNGDVTLSDLQATSLDAASGSAGTTYRLEDVSQQTPGTVVLNFDAQAVDEADTVVDLYLDEVAGSVAIFGGAVETLNIRLDEGSAAESSALTTLDVEGIQTLTISGGGAGHSFSVQDGLNETVRSLEANTSSDLVLDLAVASAAQAGIYTLGSGDDRLVLGNGFGSDDTLAGGDGSDTLSLELSIGVARQGVVSGIETLDIAFFAPATFAADNVTGLTTINLGLDSAGVAAASTADADFDALKTETQTVNIYATQRDVELDYESGAESVLTLNFVDEATPITVGDTVSGSIDLTLIEVADVTIAHLGRTQAEIYGMTDLSENTAALTISTTQIGGDLRLGETATNTVVTGTGALEAIDFSAVQGDVDFYAGTTLTNAVAIEDLSALQTYSVTGDSATLNLGAMGSGQAASELETLSFKTVHGGIIHQQAIDATGADIARVSLQTSDHNVIQTFGGAGPDVNIRIAGLTADSVSQMTANLEDGGSLLLEQQSYELHSLVLSGSGFFGIAGGAGGLVQTGPAAAGMHTGSRTFGDGPGNDVLYGSNSVDTITFFNSNGVDIYNDAGGNDFIQLTGSYDGNLLTVNDGSAETDDTYDMSSNGIATGAPGPAGGEITFNVGSGIDTLLLSSGFSGDVDIDFGTWVSGSVEITNFRAGGAAETLSFDGLPGITANQVSPAITGSVAAAGFNDNSVYLVDDGDVAVIGTTGGALDGATVADYENLSDVAGYLNAVTDGAASANQSAVFLLDNGTTTTNAGDEHDIYIYLFNDDGSGAGIQAGELQLIGTIDMSGTTQITATDIV